MVLCNYSPMEECIFCQIIKKAVPGDIVYEDDRFLAFKDIHPKAPIHLLVVPREHISSINDLQEKDEGLMGALILTAKKVAAKEGFSDSGYKLLFNVGRGGGQLVDHIHLHILSGGYGRPISEI